MILSEVGSMVHSVIVDSDAWHPRVHIDVFQIMPDHIHAIIILRDAAATTLTTGYVASRDDVTRATTLTTRDVASRGDVTRATTLTTRDVTSRDDVTVGAGPRACPRDESNQTPSRCRVAPQPDRPPHEPTHAHSIRAIEPSLNPRHSIPDTQNPPAATRHNHRETTRFDARETIRNDRHGTNHRGILGGSAHPGCHGQARGPAPTVTSSRDATSRVVNVVARVTSPRDAPDPAVNVVARGTSPRDATDPVVNVVPRAVTLSDVVQRIKSLTTARYRHAVTTDGWPPFPGRLWQRNYYERIIREERALASIRRYIRSNPRNWIEPRRRYP